MSGEFLQDWSRPQSRKRPSPALAPETSDGDSEDIEYRPRAQKFTKLSNGSRSDNISYLVSGDKPISSSHLSSSSSSPHDETQPIFQTGEHETLQSFIILQC